MPRARIPKTNKEKKEVVAWIENVGGGVPTRAVKHFRDVMGWKVTGAQIRYWWKHRDAIKGAPDLQLRLSGGSAKPELGELEDVLFDLVLFRRGNREKVSCEWIQEKARDMARAEKVSREWIQEKAREMARAEL